MIHAMLPRQVARSLADGAVRQFAHDTEVALLQLDLVGFTTLTMAVGELEIVQLLDRMYYVFDKIVEANGVYKVETIGDGMLVCLWPASGSYVREITRACAQLTLQALVRWSRWRCRSHAKRSRRARRRL